MTRRKTISAVLAAVLVVLASGAAVTLAATSTGGTGTNAAMQDETTTVAVNETTTAEPVAETTTEPAVETTEAVEETTEAAEEPAVGQQESFNVSGLSAPMTANVSETITVMANVTNPNDGEVTQSVELRLDGDVVERQNATLGAGESQNVTFEVDTTDVEAGLHVIAVQTQDFGEVGQITLLRQPETTTEGANETTTEVVEETTTEVVEETTTEEAVEETTTEAVEETTTEAVEETTTEEAVEETTTEEAVEETTTEEFEETTTEPAVETTTEPAVETTTEAVEETTTEVVEETTTEAVEETTTEPAVEEPEQVEQLVFSIERLHIDNWSFVVGDELEPDRTETIENVTISDRTQRINLTRMLMENETAEEVLDRSEQETLTPVATTTPELPEDIQTVRFVLQDITITNVTFIVELPSAAEIMPETPVPTETPEPVETTTEPAVETTTEEIGETTTEVVETTTEPAVETTTEEIGETTTEPAVETTTEPAVETTTEVDGETTTEPAVETTTEPAVETTTEPAVETTTEPAVETTTEPAVETTTEAVETTTEVDAVGPGALSFNVSDLSAPETAEVGETITVTANVTNPNDEEARQEVEFRLEGDLVERQNVTLDAGESQDVTFEVDTTDLAAGTYIHGVLTNEFGELAMLTLETEAAETTTEPAVETTTEVVETTTEPAVETTTEPAVETTTEPAVNTTTEPAVETTTEAAAEAEAEVTFSDQESDGATVTVDSVTLAEGGFVTIHNESLLDGDAFGSVVGTSEYLEAGTHENVTVELDAPITESQMLIAMPHQDTNENQVYDFVDTEGAEDGPYLTAEGEAVVDPGNVTVGTAGATTTEA